MKTLLIATKNDDKYRIASSLIGKILFDNFSFQNLKNAGIDYDITEVGSILERAEQKATEFWNILGNTNQNNYIATIGIDDGFSLIKDSEGDPNSKELTDKILNGKFIKQNDIIWLKRGFAIYNDSIGLKSCLTSIPFVYLGNPDNISRQEGIYPLSYVLCPIDKSVSMKDIEFKDAIQYYFKYCGDDLENLFIHIKNL